MVVMARSPSSPPGRATRARILEAALASFRDGGFDETTMRDVARAAGMSAGAAYYYFPSKDALVQAFYRRVAEERGRRGRTLLARTPALRDRIGGLLHLHIDLVEDDRALLAAVTRSIADPHSPLGAFGEGTRPMRQNAVALFTEALTHDEVPDDLRDLGALALFALDLAMMLFFVWDDSPGAHRTRHLIDRVVELVDEVVPWLGLPMARPMLGRLAAIVVEAGLVVEDPETESETEPENDHE